VVLTKRPELAEVASRGVMSMDMYMVDRRDEKRRAVFRAPGLQGIYIL
jgi:hypothetical protein